MGLRLILSDLSVVSRMASRSQDSKKRSSRFCGISIFRSVVCFSSRAWKSSDGCKKISLLEGCQTVLHGDCTDLARKLQGSQTSGFFGSGKCHTSVHQCTVYCLYRPASSANPMHHLWPSSFHSVAFSADLKPSTAACATFPLWSRSTCDLRQGW